MRDTSFPWLSLLLLGAVHGINPAMGWLFAVARGLQERNRRALWRALGPLALGHACAVAAALAVAVTLGRGAPRGVLRWRGGAARGPPRASRGTGAGGRPDQRATRPPDPALRAG